MSQAADIGPSKLRAVQTPRGRSRTRLRREVDWTFTTVWGVRDGLIYYHHGYTDHAEALRAIGAA